MIIIIITSTAIITINKTPNPKNRFELRGDGYAIFRVWGFVFGVPFKLAAAGALPAGGHGRGAPLPTVGFP